MFSEIFSLILSTFLFWHTTLYHPQFPHIPTLENLEALPPITLTIPKAKAASDPAILSQAYIVMNQQSGQILIEKNADLPLYPASTTKIMTALIVLENLDLDQVASVSGSLSSDGSHMGLVAGEKILVRDLLRGILIQSANDAAMVLADTFPGGEEAFLLEMNQRADQLHLQNTHFMNVVGYSQEGHYTTVRDLVILSQIAMQNPTFAQMVKERQATVYDTQGKFVHTLRTTNVLLGTVPGIEGIKTGWTEQSGECLVAQATRGDQTIITAVLGSPNRFAETTQLFSWAFGNFTTETKSFDDWMKTL